MNTPLPDHAGLRATVLKELDKQSGPQIHQTMSLETLAEAQAQIAATVKERDNLRNELAEERREHNRALDRIQLLNVQLEKTEADRDMYMRASIRYVTLIKNIHLLSAEAKSIAEEAERQQLIEEQQDGEHSKGVRDAHSELPTTTRSEDNGDSSRLDNHPG